MPTQPIQLFLGKRIDTDNDNVNSVLKSVHSSTSQDPNVNCAEEGNEGTGSMER